jgi:peptidoglycan/LPS O-acetylase OafA/YrhL
MWGDTTWNVKHIIRVATLSQNYPPGNGQFLSNPSLWTIPLEVEFYILYPVAFYLFAKSRIQVLLLITSGLASLSVYLNHQGIIWPSFTALFLWPAWLIGAYIAHMQREKKLNKCNLPLLFLCGGLTLTLALFSRLENWASWIQYISWTGFYFLLFIFCLSQPKLLIRVLGNRLFNSISWVGKISFSLYLIHFPVFKLFGYLHKEIWNEKPANFLISLAYLVPVFFLGWLFFRWVENPIHQWSRKRLAPR